MQLGQENFFATELPNSTFHEQSEHHSNYQKSASKNPSIRIRQVKHQMKQATEMYQQTLTSFMKAKNNVNKTTQQTNKLRHHFLKLYSNRKIKLMNRSMMEQNQQMCQEYKLDRNNRTRSLKLTNQLNLAYTRNQMQSNNKKFKEENRKELEIFRKTLRLKRAGEYQESRNRFEKIKQQENIFTSRRENLAAVQATKSRHNYLLKINKELQMLQDYTGLLDKVNGLNTALNGELFNSPVSQNLSQMSKTFFVTTRNSFNSR